MKTEIRTLLADLKAAMRIGNQSSIEVALDGWRNLPQVASNRSLGRGFIAQALIPLGEALAASQINEAYLQQLAGDQLAAIRAAAAIALVRRCQTRGAYSKDLIRLASEPRPEVRRALALALASGAPNLLPLTRSLVQAWLVAASLRARTTALWVLVEPAIQGMLSSADQEIFLREIRELATGNDFELQRAVRDTLDVLAAQEPQSTRQGGNN